MQSAHSASDDGSIVSPEPASNGSYRKTEAKKVKDPSRSRLVGTRNKNARTHKILIKEKGWIDTLRTSGKKKKKRIKISGRGKRKESEPERDGKSFGTGTRGSGRTIMRSYLRSDAVSVE